MSSADTTDQPARSERSTPSPPQQVPADWDNLRLSLQPPQSPQTPVPLQAPLLPASSASPPASTPASSAVASLGDQLHAAELSPLISDLMQAILDYATDQSGDSLLPSAPTFCLQPPSPARDFPADRFGSHSVMTRAKLVAEGDEILVGTPLLLRAKLNLNFANGTHLRVFDGDIPLRTSAHNCMVHAVNYVGTPRPGRSRLARCKSNEVVPPRTVLALPVVVPKSLNGQLVIATERSEAQHGSALIPRGVHRVNDGHIRIECVNVSTISIPLQACAVTPLGLHGSEFTRILNSKDSISDGQPQRPHPQPLFPPVTTIRRTEEAAQDDDAAPIGLDLPIELPSPSIIPTVVPEYDIMTCEDFEKHLQSLIDAGTAPSDIFGLDLGDMDHLTPLQQQGLRQLLTSCKSAFVSTKTELGRTHLVEHRMETADAMPIKQRPRRIPFGQREIIETEVKKMLQTGAIYPPKSPWASPVVLAKKKDGEIRFCIDYSLVNDVTKKDVYPLPRIDDTLDLLTGAMWFSSLDLQAGYWQVGMRKSDREKTAFICHMGLFELEVMRFGLTNAPATFQRLMSTLLAGYRGDTCLCFIDDTIVYTRGDFTKHLYHVSRVVSTIHKAGLKLKGKKCEFGQTSLEFLGHVVSGDGIKPNPKKLEGIRNLHAPRSQKGVRSILGHIGYSDTIADSSRTSPQQPNRYLSSSKRASVSDGRINISRLSKSCGMVC